MEKFQTVNGSNMKDILSQGDWCAVKSLFANMVGLSSNYEKQISVVKSPYFVSRLSLSKTLEFHNGCVNALNFNSTGDLIASGSDDLKICISEWCKNDTKPLFSYDSGHNGNIFQSKFMPFSNNAIIVSCARDGQVRVGYLSSEGLQETKKILRHKGSAHKLSVLNTSAHLLRSAGEDGIVYNIDLRDSPQKLVTVQNEKNKVALYSIHNNPSKEYEFAVSGRDPWARVYDQRKINQEGKKDECVQKFCPDHLKEPDEKGFNMANVTCLMYNYAGTELLCSYNDEEIYLFDTTQNAVSNYTHVYKGHRNSETVKGVNFFGPRSEYVVSGSDCGHVFIWDKKTEKVVTFLKGDEGVVNVLEPHPTSCILATSGLEHNIKIWEPIGNKFDDKQLSKQIKANEQAREQDKKQGTNRELFHLMMIMNQMRRHRRQRQRAARRAEGEGASGEGGDEVSSESDEDSDDLSTDDEDDDDEDDVTPACVQS